MARLTAQRTLFHTFDAPGDVLLLDGGRTLPSHTVAYQTWGQLNADRSNAILIFHALSGDSHVTGTHLDGRSGWWDLMVGPGRAFDTDRYFIICANVLGGCKGSTGPSSLDPATGTVVEGDIVVQTRQTLDNLMTILDAAGATAKNIVNMRVILRFVACT